MFNYTINPTSFDYGILLNVMSVNVSQVLMKSGAYNDRDNGT